MRKHCGSRLLFIKVRRLGSSPRPGPEDDDSDLLTGMYWSGAGALAVALFLDRGYEDVLPAAAASCILWELFAMRSPRNRSERVTNMVKLAIVGTLTYFSIKRGAAKIEAYNNKTQNEHADPIAREMD